MFFIILWSILWLFELNIHLSGKYLYLQVLFAYILFGLYFEQFVENGYTYSNIWVPQITVLSKTSYQWVYDSSKLDQLTVSADMTYGFKFQ